MSRRTKRRSHMGRRRIAGWDEEDAYTGWRKFYCYLDKAGAVRYIKRKTHRRERREAKREIREESRRNYDQEYT